MQNIYIILGHIRSAFYPRAESEDICITQIMIHTYGHPNGKPRQWHVPRSMTINARCADVVEV